MDNDAACLRTSADGEINLGFIADTVCRFSMGEKKMYLLVSYWNLC